MHGFLGRKNPLGQFRAYAAARKAYAEAHPGADLTQDYINVHIALGLGMRIGQNVVISPIDATKNHEYMIFGPEVNDSFAQVVFVVYQTFIMDLHVLCWSSAMTWPSSLTSTNEPDVAIMHVGSRGNNCQSPVSDVSSLELFLFRSIETNPYQTMEAFQKRWQKMH